ncbi:hypothetical protein TWF730_004408 [Orbilia blumenaviensis]|uniref:F-box domain-containing protein n=1 Tax=Orbilia blumenaviensis TaxID=1796055 RepID=A0AAV9TYD2_9PEZI
MKQERMEVGMKYRRVGRKGKIKPKREVWIPIELQLLIIELAEWTQLPTLQQVCSGWRAFILRHINTSPTILAGRYTFHPSILSDDQPPYFHQIFTYLTHYLYVEGSFYPCHIEFYDTVEAAERKRKKRQRIGGKEEKKNEGGGKEQGGGRGKQKEGKRDREGRGAEGKENEKEKALKELAITKVDIRAFARDPLIVPFRVRDPIATPITEELLSECSPILLCPWMPRYFDRDQEQGQSQHLHVRNYIIDEFTVPLLEFQGGALRPTDGTRLLSLLLVNHMKSVIKWRRKVNELKDSTSDRNRMGLLEIDVMYVEDCNRTGGGGVMLRMSWRGSKDLARVKEVTRLLY